MPRERVGSRTRLESGTALFRAGRLDEAEAECRAVIAEDPDNPDALNLLGTVLNRRGDAAAIDYVRRAIALEPNRPDFCLNLAGILFSNGKFDEAAELFGEASRMQPDSATALLNKAIALMRMERYTEAEATLRETLARHPDYVPGWINLAGTLTKIGRRAEAEEAANRAIEIGPDNPDAWLNLAVALEAQGKLSAAERANRRALDLAPDLAQAAFNLGCNLQYQWRNEEAVAAFAEATRIDPSDQPAWCNWLSVALYDPDQTEQSIFENSRRWAKQFGAAQPVSAYRIERPESIEVDRRLRIGYVSPDFAGHSCSFFLKPLIAAHDSSATEIFAYSAVRSEDENTRWFRGHVDHWRDIRSMTADAAAQKIHDDRIDILVDLAGHMNGSPIGIFRYKPAPIQVSWLGYPATTGEQQIDYRLTDAIADPHGDADKFHVERLVRLEGGFHCYSPPQNAPEVAPLPADSNRCVTFGSFNNISKITPAVVAAWAQILRSVPGSRLLLKGWMLDIAQTRARVQSAFSDHGIDNRRLGLVGWMSRDQYLDLYHQVDIGLDTFPYNGATTTFESLWMGVPVISLRGNRHAGRVGESILTHLGRSEWIAEDIEAYCAAARRLADDLPALADIRRGLRSTLRDSSLADGPGFARKVEAAYRRMWRAYIDG